VSLFRYAYATGLWRVVIITRSFIHFWVFPASSLSAGCANVFFSSCQFDRLP
jgi:hypothetical protein